jgi:hypothetical protein
MKRLIPDNYKFGYLFLTFSPLFSVLTLNLNPARGEMGITGGETQRNRRISNPQYPKALQERDYGCVD